LLSQYLFTLLRHRDNPLDSWGVTCYTGVSVAEVCPTMLIGMSDPAEPASNPHDQSPILSESREQAEPTSVQANVLSELRALIESGQFADGSRLPSERTLAAQLGICRPALREAIKALSILDVLESRRGSGTFVKSLAGLNLGWPTQVNHTGIDPNMMELLEVRKIIEPKAAALAAARATEPQLRAISQARQAWEDRSGDWSRMAQLDWDFHTAIIAASGNRVLVKVNRDLAPLMLQSRNITARTFPDAEKVRLEHYAIFEAIVCGQSAAAEQAMLEHLHSVGLDLISKLRR
jgi:GntR family transcriptional repressor for pyruvate dehydrogenase complex